MIWTNESSARICLQQGPTAKKKKQKEKPKLNVNTKLVSQKVCGEYFPEVSEKVSSLRRPVMPASPPRKEQPTIQPSVKVIDWSSRDHYSDHEDLYYLNL